MLIKVFAFQWERIRANAVTFALVVATALAVMYVGYQDDKMLQATAYLFVMWLCSFIADVYALWRPAQNDFVVRNPKRETLHFLVCVGLGILALVLRFTGIVDWQHLNGPSRLAIAPLILLFGFPIGMAVIFLLLKYKPRELGVRFQGLLVALPVIAILAITNRVVSPESLTWNQLMVESGGILGMLFSGFIMAGLSEEFMRVVGQTRLGALLHSNSLGWFLTTVIWALMHTPKWYGEDHNMTEALLSVIRIVPIGLMWGYLTHRTKSILPAVLVHGTNVWGLQNF